MESAFLWVSTSSCRYLYFTGIPNFAPELFRRAQLRDPLKMKALLKGLTQLCEEGATQLYKPINNNDLILMTCIHCINMLLPFQISLQRSQGLSEME